MIISTSRLLIDRMGRFFKSKKDNTAAAAAATAASILPAVSKGMKKMTRRAASVDAEIIFNILLSDIADLLAFLLRNESPKDFDNSYYGSTDVTFSLMLNCAVVGAVEFEGV